MARRSFTKKDRARIFTAASGVCHLCEGRIMVGEAWEVEHVIPYALTQDDGDDNLRPAHIKCHRDKTHKQDRPRISKAERQRAKHLGTWPKTKAPLQSRGVSSTRLWPVSNNPEIGDAE
jgi:5-methylcytosine-specific restriction endonuclease McrA